MSQQHINTSSPNDGLGDDLRTSQVKAESNFNELYNNKVDKVTGKGLSDVNFSQVDKDKLDSLDPDAGAQSDWNQGDDLEPDYIKNKPENLSDFNNDLPLSDDYVPKEERSPIVITGSDDAIDMTGTSFNHIIYNGTSDFIGGLLYDEGQNYAGRKLLFTNITSINVVLANDSEGYLNRFVFPNGDTTITPNETFEFWYNIDDGYYYFIGSNKTFKGVFPDLATLQSYIPTAFAGDTAQVESTPTNTNYFWDTVSSGWATPTQPVSSSAATQNLYATDTDSATSGYKTSSYIAPTTEVSKTISASSGSGIVWGEKYLYDAQYGESEINSGTWAVKLRGSIDSASGDSRVVFRAFTYSVGGVETDLFQITGSEVNDIVANSLIEVAIEAPVYQILPTYRIGYQVGFQTTSSPTRTLTYKVGGSYSSKLNAPFTFRHDNLRGKNENANFLHTTSAQQASWDAKAPLATLPIEISTNTTLSSIHLGVPIIITASCTITIPNGLEDGFNVSFITLAGATLTLALGVDVILFNNAGLTMGEKLTCTLQRRTLLNNFITAGNI